MLNQRTIRQIDVAADVPEFIFGETGLNKNVWSPKFEPGAFERGTGVLAGIAHSANSIGAEDVIFSVTLKPEKGFFSRRSVGVGGFFNFKREVNHQFGRLLSSTFDLKTDNHAQSRRSNE